MKFKDAIKQGLDKKDEDRRDADLHEQASARIKNGKPERRSVDLEGRKAKIRKGAQDAT